MKDTVSALVLDAPRAAAPGPATAIEDGDDARDAVSALVNLGYGRTEAFAAVAAAARSHQGGGVVALIRGGLLELAR